MMQMSTKPKACRDAEYVAKSFGKSLETSTYVSRGERKFAEASIHNFSFFNFFMQSIQE